MDFASRFIFIYLLLLLFLPLGKRPKGIAMNMSVSPLLRGHFSFRAVQGAFLLQISPFLVCRLIIKLFCGSFNDFEKKNIFGVKNAGICTKNGHF